MIYNSLDQLLTVWTELILALEGINHFGGDTAEIYAYTLQPDNPVRRLHLEGEMKEKAENEAALQAANTLFNVLLHFANKYECKFEIDGRRVGEWLVHEPFIHRYHIKVIPREVSIREVSEQLNEQQTKEGMSVWASKEKNT